jgi:hypothetical protein
MHSGKKKKLNFFFINKLSNKAYLGIQSSISGTNVVQTGELFTINLTVITYYSLAQFAVTFNPSDPANPSSAVSVMYLMQDSSQIIQRSYAIAGVYTVSVQSLDPSNLNTTNLTLNVVGSPACAPPVLTIQNAGSSSNPTQFTRSSYITLTGVLTISCSFNYSTNKTWSLIQLPSTEINMTSNSSAFTGYNQGVLVINPNILSYGIYMLNYTVTILYSGGGNLTQIATTYISVVPTGLNVFGFAAGVLQRSYSTAQQIVLDAGANTIDSDCLVNPRNLNYTFYCQVVPIGQSGDLFFSNAYPIANLSWNVFQLQSPNGNCFNCKMFKFMLFNLEKF